MLASLMEGGGGSGQISYLPICIGKTHGPSLSVGLGCSRA